MLDEDDDDEGFGDFKSAPSTATAAAAADDDWGDFMANSASGLAHAASLPGGFSSLKPAIGLGFASSGDPDSDPAQPGSAPGRTGADPSRWEKLKGAIPLSIFGLEEEEEAEGEAGSGNGELASLGGKGGNFGRTGSGGGANLDDLIVSLRNGVRPGDGPELGSNGSTELEIAGGKVSDFGGDEVGSSPYAHVNGKNEVGFKTMGSGLKWDPLDMNPSRFGSVGTPYAIGATSGLVEGVEVIANGGGGHKEEEEEEEDDDDGWEFKFAEAEVPQREEVAQVNQIMYQNGDLTNLNGQKPSWTSSSLDFHGWNSKADEVSSNSAWFSTGLAVDHEGDEGNSIWQIEDIDSRSQDENGNSLGSMTSNGGFSNVNLPRPELGNIMFPLGPTGLSLNSGGAASQKQQLAADSANQDEDCDEAEEWGFKSAQPMLQFDGTSKIQRMENENTPTNGSVAQHSSWNIVNSSMGGVHSNLDKMNLGERDSNSNSVEGSQDMWADDAWEFRTAESEAKAKGSNNEVDLRRPENSESLIVTSGVGNDASGNEELFVASQLTSQKSGGWDFGFGFTSSSVMGNNIASRTILHNNVGNSMLFSPADGNFHSAEASWAFKDTTLDSSAVEKEVPTSARNSPALEALAFDSTKQVLHQKRALPLSIFGEEEIESDDPGISEDIATEMAKSEAAHGFNSSHPNVSIKDLISSLYSQMEHTSSNEQAVNHSENGSGFTDSMIDSNMSIGDNDNLEDDSWEFQDATVGNMAQDQNRNLANVYANESTAPELKDCLSLFIKLKEELLFAALGYHENLKKAQNDGAIIVNDDEIDALHKEIQDIDFELGKDAIVSTTPTPRERNFNYFVEILQEPNFCMFDAEYEISKKLLMVEDSKSVIELLKLVASIVRILKLVCREDQLSYISTWSKMLAACAQELRHGALIWKKLLEKSARDTLLSERRGKDYVLSLGEIYRVAEVLGSSARVYKPWIYVNSVDPMSLATLLNECASLWSTSGLEEALRTLCDSSDVKSCRNCETLVESIKYIQDMDVNAFHDHVFSGAEPTCQLSLLKALPGMQMVFWDGKPYLLTTANLWANLINCDPPVLPIVRIQ